MFTVNHYKRAKVYYANGEYEQSRELFIKAAAKGNANAMFSLGIMYLFGQGTEIDVQLAKSYLLKAKYSNHPIALFYWDIIKDIEQGDFEEG